MAIASRVFSWSKPKVKEKRRASSLMPQKADDERSMLMPSSDNMSLKSYRRKRQHHEPLSGLLGNRCLFQNLDDILQLSHHLQAQYECLWILDFVNLPCLAHCFLNDIPIVIVKLRREEKDYVLNRDSMTPGNPRKFVDLPSCTV